jgi:TPR repeat protein
MSKKLFCALAAVAALFGMTVAQAAPDSVFEAVGRNDWTTVRNLCEGPAKAGDSVCQDMLGTIYADGRGVPADPKTALHWFQLAAAQGNHIAEYNLGRVYEFGEGVPKNIAEAENWYAKSAEAGVPYAQWRLGMIAVEVHHDWKTGLKFLRPAAAQGIREAQGALGFAYEEGQGVKKNAKLAAKWYLAAADHGQSFAQERIATLYERGEGVDQDYKEAYFWYAVALRDPKNPRAKQDGEGLKRVAAKLSAVDVSDARQIAKDWKPEEENIGSKKSSRRSASSRARGDPKLVATGTGFFVAHDGSLITNNHVVARM